MMVSLFTQFVCKGVEVPAIDPVLLAHVDIQAALAQVEESAVLSAATSNEVNSNVIVAQST
jgi:hypothetical protein